MDIVDPLIARVSRRASGLSNLTLDSAEDLQVDDQLIIKHYQRHVNEVNSPYHHSRDAS